MFAQEGHAQLVYRFCIPLASFLLWQFLTKPQLKTFLAMMIMIVWQFYLTIYIGFFLILILLCMVLIAPFFIQIENKIEILKFWPVTLKQAWFNSNRLERVLCIPGIFLICYLLYLLLTPYVEVTTLYGFSRSKDDIASMLPRITSYFLSDNSLLWRLKGDVLSEIPMRHEHQLFPGFSICILILVRLLWKVKADQPGFATINFITGWLIFLLTLNINGFSFYLFLSGLPGFNSIRAVTRIQLALMWPIAVSASFVLDALLRSSGKEFRSKLAAVLLVGFMVLESTFYGHIMFSKVDAHNRIAELRDEVELAMVHTKGNPVIFINGKADMPWYVNELDAMLVAQEVNVPTLNGYSGNTPPDTYHHWDHTCKNISQSFNDYLEVAGTYVGKETLPTNVQIVPVRFNNCHPTWSIQDRNSLY